MPRNRKKYAGMAFLCRPSDAPAMVEQLLPAKLRTRAAKIIASLKPQEAHKLGQNWEVRLFNGYIFFLLLPSAGMSDKEADQWHGTASQTNIAHCPWPWTDDMLSVASVQLFLQQAIEGTA